MCCLCTSTRTGCPGPTWPLIGARGASARKTGCFALALRTSSRHCASLHALPTPTTAMETSDPDCLRDLFDQFCAFGAGQSSSFRMDGATFTKFCKDTGLLDKQLNKTAVDLIFMQSKQKTERKISFEEFRDQAIPLLAQRKFPSVDPATATGRLVALALQCPGPVATATRTSTMGIYAKLTDASLYTGHHRVRAGGGAYTPSATVRRSALTLARLPRQLANLPPGRGRPAFRRDALS